MLEMQIDLQSRQFGGLMMRLGPELILRLGVATFAEKKSENV
jgi:hypothetical protein